MLKKQLCMIIICCCLVQPLLILSTEQDIYNIDAKDTVTPSHEPKAVSLKSIEDPNIDTFKKIDDIDDDERAFVDACPHLEPSRTEKMVAVLAPYIIPLLPYYVSMAARVHSMKLCAVRCYRAIAKSKAAQPDQINKS